MLIDLNPAARNGSLRVTFQKANTGYAYKVLPGYQIRLPDYGCTAPSTITEDDADDLLKDLKQELSDQQMDMFGAAAQQLTTPNSSSSTAATSAATPFANPKSRPSNSLMVVIQGTDGAGKDGLIRDVFGGLNPLWVRCDGFKAATFDEVGRDFLWRSHRIAPMPGYTSAFHRSYYEGV